MELALGLLLSELGEEVVPKLLDEAIPSVDGIDTSLGLITPIVAPKHCIIN